MTESEEKAAVWAFILKLHAGMNKVIAVFTVT